MARLPATLLCSHSTPSMHVHFSKISFSLLLFFISSRVKLHNNVADFRRVDSKQTQQSIKKDNNTFAHFHLVCEALLLLSFGSWEAFDLSSASQQQAWWVLSVSPDKRVEKVKLYRKWLSIVRGNDPKVGEFLSIASIHSLIPSSPVFAILSNCDIFCVLMDLPCCYFVTLSTR